MTAHYDIAIVDSQPQVVMNTAGVVDLIARSPIGIAAALMNLRGSMRPETYALVEAEMRRRLEERAA